MAISTQGLLGLASVATVLLTFCCITSAIALRELTRMKIRKKPIVNDLPHIVEHVEDTVDMMQAESMTNQVNSNHGTDMQSTNIKTTPTNPATSTVVERTLSGDVNGSRSKGKANVNSKSQKKVQFVIELPV